MNKVLFDLGAWFPREEHNKLDTDKALGLLKHFGGLVGLKAVDYDFKDYSNVNMDLYMKFRADNGRSQMMHLYPLAWVEDKAYGEVGDGKGADNKSLECV